MQAEKLPAYLLMEKENTTRVIEQQLQLYGNERSPEVMNQVLQVLTEKFHVSRSMAKIRMKELGYPEAEGLCNYIGQNNIPDYGCGEAWPEGLTYVVSPAAASRAWKESLSFREAAAGGRFVYAEGHFCLDDPKYIQGHWKGVPVLTAYARHHIEECCIGFKISGWKKDTRYNRGVAARLNSGEKKYLGNIECRSVPGTREWKRDNEDAAEDAKRWARLKRNLPRSLPDAVRMIMEEKKISVKNLTDDLGISRQYYYSMMSDEMSLAHLVGICVSLNIRADVSFMLVDLCRYNLTDRGPDQLYLTMLVDPTQYSIDRCNEILTENGYDPLFPKRRNSEEQLGA